MNAGQDFSSLLLTHGAFLFIGSIRLAAFFALAPIFDNQSIPGQLKFALALALSALVYPLSAAMPLPHDGHWFLWLASIALKEILIGFVLAYAVGVVFWVMLSSGRLVDSQRGAAIAELVSAPSGDSTSLFGDLLNQATVYLFFSTGAFVQIVALLLVSYEVCPPGFALGEAQLRGMTAYLLDEFARLMVMVALFAFPIVLVCLASDVCLGIVNRFSPQLNVFFLALPIKSVLGLLMIFFYLRYMTPLITRELFGISGRLQPVWKLFAP